MLAQDEECGGCEFEPHPEQPFLMIFTVCDRACLCLLGCGEGQVHRHEYMNDEASKQRSFFAIALPLLHLLRHVNRFLLF